MAFDAFLKVDGIPGESKDDRYKNWIEIKTFAHGVDQPVSRTVSSAGGATAERADFEPVTITKEVDISSPKLWEASYTGKHIKEVIIELCRAGGNKEKYLEIRMENVLVSNFRQGSGGEFPVEHVSFAPGKITMTYNQQKREDGMGGGCVAAGWDLQTNKTCY
ncbi:MAG: type VI secretion system tube protein Hcp [Azoarcus sp.]|jgi:type VI secretion system secreted protein Hcp|nr:type VI secretion system tube protein Hcp [Azoarcus sp.]